MVGPHEVPTAQPAAEASPAEAATAEPESSLATPGSAPPAVGGQVLAVLAALLRLAVLLLV